MDTHERVSVLANCFSSCSKMLTAIGDETRQHLIVEMMKMNDCRGVRVCEIAQKQIFRDRLFLIIYRL